MGALQQMLMAMKIAAGGGGGGAGGVITWESSAAAAADAVNVTSQDVPFPTEAAGEKLIIFQAIRTSSEDTPSAPSGFALPTGGTVSGGGGSWGFKTGPARAIAWEKTAAGSESGNSTVSWTDSASTATAFMVNLSGENAGWQTTACSSGTSTGGAISVTGGSTIDFEVNDLLIALYAANTNDGVMIAQTLTASGITFDTVTERPSAFGTLQSGGNTVSLAAFSANVTAGSGTVAPAATITWSEGTPAGAMLFIRVRNEA